MGNSQEDRRRSIDREGLLTAVWEGVLLGMRRLIPFFAVLVLASCGGERTLNQGRLGLGTLVQIRLWGESDSLLEAAAADAFAEIERVEGLTSVFQPESGVWRLNNRGEVVSAELAGLIRKALEVSAKSAGAFDPTVFPLLELWGFYDSTGCERKVPSQGEIEEALALVDYDMVTIKGDTVRFDPERMKGVLRGWGVDLGGIAKGYAVDRAVKVLREQGVEKGIVDAGGDILCFGHKSKGWSIGIRDPRSANPNDLRGIIKIDSGAVATSGDYENYFEADGIRYHHLLDPATGMPAREAISATVLAPTATQADAWATALFVLGEEGIALLEELEGLEGLIVLADETVLTTKGFPEVKKL